MTLGMLIEMQQNGVLKVKHEDGDDFGVIGGTTRITTEEAIKLCNRLGWTEFYLNPYEIINKTGRFVASLRKSQLMDAWSQQVLANTTIEFMNRRGSTYGKTFDRIELNIGNLTKCVIIYNMEHMGAKYVIYMNGSSIPQAKCRTISKVGEYLATLG